jgi:hypothetical protein
MLANTKRVYALANFTVELRTKGWHFWRTYGDKSDMKGRTPRKRRSPS